MNFLSWHYTYGLKFYFKRYLYSLAWISHFFSLPLLLPTLFAPWKRLVDETKKPGFDFVRYFERVSFNFVSRFIGAVVRLGLFIIGSLIFIGVLIFGGIGFFVWLLIPLLSLKIYLLYTTSPENIAKALKIRINTNPSRALEILFDNEAGKFVLDHLGLSLSEMSANAKVKEVTITNFEPKSFEELLNWFVEKGMWEDSFFRKKSILPGDMVMAAKWWDRRKEEEVKVEEFPEMGRPGIGLELLYGYTPILDQHSIDLGVSQEFSHHLIGRQNIVSRMERVLASGNSIILVGTPGVGKKTVVLEFARRASLGELGSKLSYKRVLELDCNFLFSGSADLNQKKAILANILAEASSAGNVILVIRDLHRITNPDLEGLDFTDAFESFLERRELKVIAISTSTDYEHFLAQNLKLRKFFETVEVVQPAKEEAMDILLEATGRWEGLKKITISIQALKKVLEGSDRYITETPYPEKALELLDAVVMYKEQQGGAPIISEDVVNKVLSEKTGVSFARLTSSERKRLTNLEEIIHERLVDQEVAVELIARILRSKSVGVVNSNRPLGSFLFLGPTGVGKTETAKVLARVYFGSEKNILRFDMAEYAGQEGLERLIGSSARTEPGALTTAIKNRPASLLLLDEIEKAPPEVFNLFLSLLDEGMMTDAFGRKFNCQNLFVIATSNAAASYVREQVSKNIKGEELQKNVTDYILKKGIFSPEFINRFDGTVVYEPLGKEELLKVARLMFMDLSENLKNKNILTEVIPETYQKLVDLGYDPSFGARPMRRIIEIELGDIIGKAILKGEIVSGDKIMILPGEGKEKFAWKKL